MLEAADIAFARVNDWELLSKHPHLRRITVGAPSGPVSMPAPAPLRAGEERRYGADPGAGRAYRNDQEGISLVKGGRAKRAMALLAIGVLIALSIQGVVSAAPPQPAALSKSQSDALKAYNETLAEFKAILRQRRAQIDADEPLPDLPGQALYIARINMMSAYKDLTDAIPSKIGRPNKFGIPPAYFDAETEALIDEYRNLFTILEAPPANAQKSDTPLKDVVALSRAIARAKGLDEANADAAGLIGLGIFFAETNGHQNIGNARSNKYKGSLQTGISEDRNGRKKWAAIKDGDCGVRPRAHRARRQGGSPHRKFGSPAQSLDRRARRPYGRARGSFPANTGNCEDFVKSDRPDEVLRTYPDRSRRPRGRLSHRAI